jgi:hypothetical protein
MSGCDMGCRKPRAGHATGRNVIVHELVTFERRGWLRVEQATKRILSQVDVSTKDLAQQITVQVQPRAARELSGEQPPSTDVAELQAGLRNLGLEMLPMHPGLADAELATYFSVRVPGNDERSASALNFLRQNPAVTAAYVKPPDEPPSE